MAMMLTSEHSFQTEQWRLIRPWRCFRELQLSDDRRSQVPTYIIHLFIFCQIVKKVVLNFKFKSAEVTPCTSAFAVNIFSCINLSFQWAKPHGSGPKEPGAVLETSHYSFVFLLLFGAESWDSLGKVLSERIRMGNAAPPRLVSQNGGKRISSATFFLLLSFFLLHYFFYSVWSAKFSCNFSLVFWIKLRTWAKVPSFALNVENTSKMFLSKIFAYWFLLEYSETI